MTFFKTFVFSGFFLCAALAAGQNLSGQQPEFRTWRTADGKASRIKMAALRLSDDNVRFKREDNGREFDFPINGLSGEAQQFLREQFGKTEQSEGQSDEQDSTEQVDQGNEVADNPANSMSNVRWQAPILRDDNIDRWMEYIQPSEEELAWRTKIRWHTSLATAAKEAKELQRPILLWTMNGNPCGET